MRNQRGNGIAVLIAILAFIVAAASFFGSPFLKAYELKAAIERGDDVPVVASIDFEAVKANLGSKVPSLKSGGSANYLELAFKKILATLADPGLVSQAIRQFGPEAGRYSSQVQMDLGFKDWNTFEIRSSFKGQAFVTTMERRGLAGWAIVAVELG